MYFCASSRLCSAKPDEFDANPLRAHPLHRPERPQIIWRILMKLKSPIYPWRKPSLPIFLFTVALLSLTALTASAQTQTDTATIQDPGNVALALPSPTPACART